MSILQKITGNSVAKSSSRKQADAAKSRYDAEQSNYFKVSASSHKAIDELAALFARRSLEEERVTSVASEGADAIVSAELVALDEQIAEAQRVETRWAKAATIAEARRGAAKVEAAKLEKLAVSDEYVATLGRLGIALDSARPIYKELVEIFSAHSRELPGDLMEAASLILRDGGIVDGLMNGVRAYLTETPKAAPALPAGHRIVRFVRSTNAEGKFASMQCFAKGETAGVSEEMARALIADGVCESV